MSRVSLTFDELATMLGSFCGRDIQATVQNNTRRYYWEGLKPSVSYNPDVCGVSLNHTQQPQRYRTSRFHDEEDVNITFNRDEVQESTWHEDDAADRVNIFCGKFGVQLDVIK